MSETMTDDYLDERSIADLVGKRIAFTAGHPWASYTGVVAEPSPWRVRSLGNYPVGKVVLDGDMGEACFARRAEVRVIG